MTPSELNLCVRLARAKMLAIVALLKLLHSASDPVEARRIAAEILRARPQNLDPDASLNHYVEDDDDDPSTPPSPPPSPPPAPPPP